MNLCYRLVSCMSFLYSMETSTTLIQLKHQCLRSQDHQLELLLQLLWWSLPMQPVLLRFHYRGILQKWNFIMERLTTGGFIVYHISNNQHPRCDDVNNYWDFASGGIPNSMAEMAKQQQNLHMMRSSVIFLTHITAVDGIVCFIRLWCMSLNCLTNAKKTSGSLLA